MKKILSLALAVVAFISITSNALASEGLVELRNRVGDDARCFASSVLMSDQSYTILVSCRDILYPGGTQIFNYVVWATSQNGTTFRLGTLNLGKVQFRTQQAFVNLFVTKEPTANPNTPTGQVVMQGPVRPIALLDNNRLNSPTTTPGTNQPEMVSPGPEEVVQTPVPSAAPRTGVAQFLTGGILAIFGIAGIIFLLFIITKK